VAPGPAAPPADPPPPARAAVDSTGYDARPVSHYYVRRAGRRSRQRRWPRLTAVADTRAHQFLSAAVTRGPAQDAPRRLPAVRRAVKNRPIDTLLAAAAYDAEANHATCREGLGIRSTVIALNWRGSRKWPATKFRRQMVRRFRKKPAGSRYKRVYGQRWQVEKDQADCTSRRRWVGTRRIGYHRRDGVARTGRVVPATSGGPHRRSRMSDTTRRPPPPRA
jgi:hypothetical protein